VEVSILGLGGGGRGANPQIRGTTARPDVEKTADEILHRALDAGVNYIDTCTGYGESERIIGGVAATRRREMFLATKCNRCHVPGDQLRRELDQSLRRLQTDSVDLWQIHNVRNAADVEAIFRPDHAIDVFQKAKEEGTARFIGISVHSSRRVIELALARCRQAGVAMDTLLFSFNVADRFTGGHGKRVLDDHPSIGKIAMKVFASDGAPIVRREGIPAATALRYVLSHRFATAIVGTHSLEELEENLQIVRSFQPLSEEDLREVDGRVRGQSQQLWTLQA
jgi:aryl-alcohol dehydrogenase-like predicted oxidoreductase